MNFGEFEALSFDCYGTLTDWETGITRALRSVLETHDQSPPDEEILRLYSTFERRNQSGGFMPYRAVLRMVTYDFASHYGFGLDEGEDQALVQSLPNWPPFPDTINALRALKSRYRLCILSNIDNDLMDETLGTLGVKFDEVVTAEQVRSYKPQHAHFKEGLRRLEIPAEKLLHVAESRFHDIVPAKKLGLANVWVNRQEATGRFQAASGTADVIPDLEVQSMAKLVKLTGLEGAA